MKSTDFKKIIKEAVKEAIQEELKDILLEAVRAPKAPISETYQMNNLVQPVTTSAPQKSSAEKRAMMESIMGDMRRGQDTISMTTANLNSFQVPQGINTTAEGSSLPQGNVGLDQIMALMNK